MNHNFHYDGETNPHGMSLEDWQKTVGEHYDGGHVDWKDPLLAKIVRLRLLSDPGFPSWDVSYCYGVLKDGTKVTVQLPFNQIPKRWKGNSKLGCRGNWWGAIKFYAKKDGVNLWNLKVWESISKLI